MKKIFLLLFIQVFVYGMDQSMKEVIDEYYPQYCQLLEAAYGKSMMSEGGREAIDFMFKGLSIKGKKALDIGSGLGGVAYYLANEYNMKVTGLEINPWIVEEAKQKIPAKLQNNLNFILNNDNNKLPFEDNSFDIIYSKGVLCHVENKQGIFNECYRVLKPRGTLIINDWLSPKKGKWGSYIQRLVELEGLTLYAETIDGYLKFFKEGNFNKVEVINLSKQYALYNEDIVKKLNSAEKKKNFINSFNEQLYIESIDGYDSIAKAMHSGEGMVIQFSASKK